MPVRPLILSPAILVRLRALRGDPADLLLHARGEAAARTARTARTF